MAKALDRAGPISATQLRSFGLLGILVVIGLVFQLLTDGVFLTPRNLTNPSGQVAITAVLAAGIVFGDGSWLHDRRRRLFLCSGRSDRDHSTFTASEWGAAFAQDPQGS